MTKVRRSIRRQQKGFTIVELLIVVVVIAILAAITIVAYNGIQNRAKDSRVRSDLGQISKKVETTKITSGSDTYPADLSAAGVSSPPAGVTYSVTATGKGYCANIAGDSGTSYYVTQNISTPTSGSCGTVQGLMGWWPMNGNAQDASGNNLGGTPENVTLTTGNRDKVDGAYSFNGTSSRIVCGTSDLIRPTDAYTITAWVQPTVFPGGSNVATVISNGATAYRFVVNPSASPLSYTAGVYAFGSGGVLLNAWSFIAVRYSPTAGTRVSTYTSSARGYSENDPSVAPTAANYGTTPCTIGSRNNVAGEYFTGKIDDVRIFNSYLASSDLTTLYDAGAY